MAKPDKIVSVKSDQISSLKLLGLLNISIHKQHPSAKGFFFTRQSRSLSMKAVIMNTETRSIYLIN